MSYLLNIPFTLIYGIFLAMVGWITYAYFKYRGCDPYEAGMISNRNQVLPYLVYDAMDDIPGMAGLYIATLFCGSLSTLSSGINALAANTVEDILERPLKNASERTATIVTKIAAAFYGVMICCLGFSAQFLSGTVIEMSTSTFSGFGTPILGMFLIGSAVPWATKQGAIAGAIVSLAFNLWIIIGSRLYHRKLNVLPSAGTSNCVNVTSSSVLNLSKPMTEDSILGLHPYGIDNSTIQLETPQDSDGYGFFPYDISFEWHAVCGITVALVVGLAVSYCTRGKTWKKNHCNPSLVFPICRRIWSLNNCQEFELR